MVDFRISQIRVLLLSFLLNAYYNTVTNAFSYHTPARCSFCEVKAGPSISHQSDALTINFYRRNSYLNALSEDNNLFIESNIDSDLKNQSLQRIGDELKANDINHDWTQFTTAAIAIATVLCALPLVSNAASPVAIVESASISISSLSSVLGQFYETGFYQAFSLVFLSEIGDKTFFIAGLLAIKFSRVLSFLGSIGALAVMTIISCIIGQIFHAVPSGLTQGVPLDDILAVIAFAFFGFKTLKEALEMDDGGGVMDEELAEAEEAVDGSSTTKQETAIAKILGIFTLVFAAEFGDRSFLATIALSAAQNPVSVAGGAIAAHAAATGIAVLGGGVIAKYISERVLGFISGTLFIVFAITTALGIF